MSGTAGLINTECKTEPVGAGRSAAILSPTEQVTGPKEENVHIIYTEILNVLLDKEF